MRRSVIIVAATLLSACLLNCLVFAQGPTQSAKSLAVIDPLDRPVVKSHAAPHSVLLDVTKAGTRFIAVGERGIIILSDDGGRSWKQADVPTSVSLTAVRFVSPKSGWAVGHSGVVLHTEDGGTTWTNQLDGRMVAKLAVEYAQSLVAKPGVKKDSAERLLADAQRLEADGPDKPFLAIYFEDENKGFIVGAYGLTFRTEDAGKTWKPWMDRVENPRGMHIYAIAGSGKMIYMAGEQGLFLKSNDGGEKFTKVETPYKGTYFNLALLPSGELVLGGMRGNAYRSADQGKTFQAVQNPIPVSFSAVTLLGNGTVVFANQAGQLLASNDAGKTMHPLPVQGLPPISGITEAGNGMLMTVGFMGAIPVPLEQSAPSQGGAR